VEKVIFVPGCDLFPIIWTKAPRTFPRPFEHIGRKGRPIGTSAAKEAKSIAAAFGLPIGMRKAKSIAVAFRPPIGMRMAKSIAAAFRLPIGMRRQNQLRRPSGLR